MTLSKILRIMKFALLNPEKYDETYIKKKFGEQNYELFSQFCLGGKSALAHYIGDPKLKLLKLTQEGVRQYHLLQTENSQKQFNRVIAVTGAVVATGVILNIANEVNAFEYMFLWLKWLVVSILGIILLFSLGYLVTFLFNTVFKS